MGVPLTKFRRWLLSCPSLAPYALLGSALTGPFPNAPAHAEDAQIEDVRVTNGTGELSKRRLEVLNIPRPIVVVDPKTAERERLYRLEDFAEKVPNYQPKTGSAVTSRPSIRGVGSTLGPLARCNGNPAGSEFDTGFVLDNVSWKNPGFQNGDFSDIESFEIGHGPQGTAGGKNTTVGSIVIRTQPPSFERKATIETSFANNNRVIEKANVTGPIVENALAYRVAAYFDKGDGWIRDQVSGAGYLNNDRFGVRGQLLYVGEHVTNRLIFSFGEANENKNCSSYASGPFADSFQMFANGTTPARTYAQNVWFRLGKPILTFDPYRPYHAGARSVSDRHYTVSNELNWTIGENTLTSISAYGSSSVTSNNLHGINLLDTTSGVYHPYVEQLSQELRFASPKEQAFEWLLGSYANYEDAWAHSTSRVGVDAVKWFGRPALYPAGDRAVSEGKARTFHIAGYAQGTYHVDDRLALTLGLRESYEIKEGSIFTWNSLFPGPFTPAEQLQAIRGAGLQTFFDTGGRTKRFNLFSAIVNPQYRISENILVYGLVGRGEKAGAINAGGGGGPGGVPVFDDRNSFQGFLPLFTKSEVSWDYEIGAKTNWFDGSLIANVNLYWNDLYNFQANLIDSSFRNSLGEPIRNTYLGNARHARLRGIEFDGRWNPFERLWFNFSGAYTEARWLDFDNAPPPEDWLWTTGPLRAPQTLSRTNTRWEGLPLWSYNIGFNYEQPLGSYFRDLGDWANRPVTGFVYSNLAWRDKALLTDPHSVFRYWAKPYALVNFGFGLRTDDERYSLTFWSKNIFDERPVTSWSPGSPSAPATIGLPFEPRTFGASVLVKLD